MWVLDPLVDQLAGAVRSELLGLCDRIRLDHNADGVLRNGDDRQRSDGPEDHQDAHHDEGEDGMIVDEETRHQSTDDGQSHGRNQDELLPVSVVLDTVAKLAKDQRIDDEAHDGGDDAKRKARHERHHHGRREDEGDERQNDILTPQPERHLHGLMPCAKSAGDEDESDETRDQHTSREEGIGTVGLLGLNETGEGQKAEDQSDGDGERIGEELNGLHGEVPPHVYSRMFLSFLIYYITILYKSQYPQPRPWILWLRLLFLPCLDVGMVSCLEHLRNAVLLPFPLKHFRACVNLACSDSALLY